MNSPQFGFCIDEAIVERARVTVELLKQHNLTVVTAESCTGGLIASALSHVPGASECLHGGFVVYSKELKAIALGVSAELLRSEGSVNEEVARQLADGALQRSPAQLAIAVTGVLGPNPDEDGNVPGRVFFAVARRGATTTAVAEFFSSIEPDEVRRAVVLRAFALLRTATG